MSTFVTTGGIICASPALGGGGAVQVIPATNTNHNNGTSDFPKNPSPITTGLEEDENDIIQDEVSTVEDTLSQQIGTPQDTYINIQSTNDTDYTKVQFYVTTDNIFTINIEDISFMKAFPMYTTATHKTVISEEAATTDGGETEENNSETNNETEESKETEETAEQKPTIQYTTARHFSPKDSYFEVYMRGSHNGLHITWRDGIQIQNIMQSKPYGLFRTSEYIYSGETKNYYRKDSEKNIKVQVNEDGTDYVREENGKVKDFSDDTDINQDNLVDMTITYYKGMDTVTNLIYSYTLLLNNAITSLSYLTFANGARFAYTSNWSTMPYVPGTNQAFVDKDYIDIDNLSEDEKFNKDIADDTGHNSFIFGGSMNKVNTPIVNNKPTVRPAGGWSSLLNNK